jgi:hypothetical protein
MKEVERAKMTKLLERAFSEASKLPSTEQDEIAERWLAELQAEHRWNEAFANSQDELARLADEALAEHAAGLTGELKPEQL